MKKPRKRWWIRVAPNGAGRSIHDTKMDAKLMNKLTGSDLRIAAYVLEEPARKKGAGR